MRPGSRGGLDLYKASSKKVKIAHSTKTKECEGINYPLQNMCNQVFLTFSSQSGTVDAGKKQEKITESGEM